MMNTRVGPPPQLPSRLPNRPAEAPPPLPKRDASTTGGGAPPLPKRNPSTQPTTNTEINKASQPPALPSRSSTVNQQIEELNKKAMPPPLPQRNAMASEASSQQTNTSQQTAISTTKPNKIAVPTIFQKPAPGDSAPPLPARATATPTPPPPSRPTTLIVPKKPQLPPTPAFSVSPPSPAITTPSPATSTPSTSNTSAPASLGPVPLPPSRPSTTMIQPAPSPARSTPSLGTSTSPTTSIPSPAKSAPTPAAPTPSPSAIAPSPSNSSAPASLGPSPLPPSRPSTTMIQPSARQSVAQQPAKTNEYFGAGKKGFATMKDGGGQYSAVITDARKQEMIMGSDKSFVMMYHIQVTKGDKSWTIFRRYNQFYELDHKLKKYGILPKNDKSMPPKDATSKRDDPQLVEMRKKALNTWLQNVLAIPQAHDFEYFYTFIEPIQMGDIRPSK